MKICTKCQIEKEENEFNNRRISKDGLRAECKECQKKDSKDYVVRNKDKIKENYQKNRESRISRSKKWKEEHKETYLEQQRQYRKVYYQENKEIINERKKQHYQKNKDKYFKYEKEYKKKKYHEDVFFKFRVLVSSAILKTCKENEGSKRGYHTWECLPYTVTEFKEYFENHPKWEPWMNWKNNGVYVEGGERKWHIDHIIPQSKLPFDSLTHPNFLKCWALDNLQPLDAVVNMKKGDKIYMSDPKDTDIELEDPSSLYNPEESTEELVSPEWWSSIPEGNDSFPKKEIDPEAPQDNIGRSICYFCGKPTIKKPLFHSFYEYCEKCKK